jgi:hypothetical protein
MNLALVVVDNEAIDPTVVASIDDGSPSASAGFVIALQKELPKRVDGRTTLVSVSGDGDVITLGHRVSGELADEAAFAETTKDQIVAGTCAPIADSNIRTLNDEGVAFRFIYADARGNTIAAITLEPAFCSDAR